MEFGQRRLDEDTSNSHMRNTAFIPEVSSEILSKCFGLVRMYKALAKDPDSLEDVLASGRST